MALLHASCVAIDGIGVLIRGPSGVGKSDLALRLIDAGAVLVADDYCDVAAAAGRLIARVPDTISGQLEVRGFGIVRISHLASVPVGLVVDLGPEEKIERMPDRNDAVIEGCAIAVLTVDPHTPSAAAKVRLALRAERIAPATRLL